MEKVAAYLHAQPRSVDEIRTAIHLLVYAHLKSKTGIPLMIELSRHENQEVCWSAVHLLGDEMGGDPRAADVFLAVLQQGKETPEIRREAIIGLGCTRDPRAVAPLVAQLKDRDKETVETARWALAEMNDPSTAAHLAPLLKNRDPAVREAAEALLAHLKESHQQKTTAETGTSNRATTALQ